MRYLLRQSFDWFENVYDFHPNRYISCQVTRHLYSSEMYLCFERTDFLRFRDVNRRNADKNEDVVVGVGL